MNLERQQLMNPRIARSIQATHVNHFVKLLKFYQRVWFTFTKKRVKKCRICTGKSQNYITGHSFFPSNSLFPDSCTCVGRFGSMVCSLYIYSCRIEQPKRGLVCTREIRFIGKCCYRQLWLST